MEYQRICNGWVPSGRIFRSEPQQMTDIIILQIMDAQKVLVNMYIKKCFSV
jgi:hypothetical protein